LNTINKRGEWSTKKSFVATNNIFAWQYYIQGKCGKCYSPWGSIHGIKIK